MKRNNSGSYIDPKSSEKHIPLFRQNLVDKIALDMVEICAKVKRDEKAMIFYDTGGSQLATAIAKLTAQKGAKTWYYIRDMKIDKQIATYSSPRNIARSQTYLDPQIHEADVVFLIRCPESPFEMEDVPSEKMTLWSGYQRPVLMDYRVNYTRWNLIYWPTPKEAEIENMPYEEYVELFFSSCNQPWKQIEKTQEKLVEVLNKGRTLELFAKPNDPKPENRTHLTMDITPMKFDNSTIGYNYPGSEVYASPVINSVQGNLFAEGKYSYEGRRMEDIHLKVRNGKIVDASARVGQKQLQEILGRDEGARYFGEVAIGTNPGLRRRLFNPLLNEKVGGSFHITPGKAYEDISHPGHDIHIDNGNRSSIHWDITIMMHPQYGGGEIKVDGKTIQKDGRFIDPKLSILNKGLD